MNPRLALLLVAALLLASCVPTRERDAPSRTDPSTGFTVEQRVAQFAASVATRVEQHFDRAGLDYPPRELTYLAFKDSATLEVYARDAPTDAWSYVMEYPVLAASGVQGPKLREGDRQVPEGLYRAALLNPNSRYHLSIGLDYPNEHDRHIADSMGRTGLGGDIMIHGDAVSIGCLAMGDTAAEDLFILAAHAGRENVRIIVAPTDFRRSSRVTQPEQRRWVHELYARIASELRAYKRDR